MDQVMYNQNTYVSINIKDKKMIYKIFIAFIRDDIKGFEK